MSFHVNAGVKPATSLVRQIVTLLSVLALAIGLGARAASVDYVYDEGGRLVGVYAPNGDAAQYVYDPAGNITDIKRIASATLSIIEFLPKSGPVGTQVTIWGTGFSVTASQNTVIFNGTAASVVSAASNRLVVTVPAGATSGLVSVTVAGGSASSTKPFVVTGTTSCTSGITGFSPAIGAAGTAVAISVSGFDSGVNFVQFNGMVAPMLSATSTTLTANVPTGATSGRLVVSMPPNCAAINAGDFFVPPSPLVAADIGVTGRLTINGPSTTVTLASGKKALYVFDANAGDGAGVYLSSSTLGTVTIDIRAPDSTMVTTATISLTNGKAGPVYLPMTGGYSVLITPTSAGSATLQLAAPDLAISNPSVGTITGNQNGSFNVPVGFTVTNLGAAAAQPNWYDSGYLSRGVSLDPTSVAIGFAVHNAALAPGANYTVSQTYSVTGFTPGTYTLFLATDSNGTGTANPRGDVIESNESNNTIGISIVLPTYPDLTISNSSVGTITENQNGSFNIPVNFTVANVGVNPALPNWSDYGYLSSSGVLDSGSTVLNSTQRMSALAGGANYTVTQTFVTSGVNPGTYTLFLKADAQGAGLQASNGVVAESNESNNTVARSIVLPAYPDLSISNASVGAITENQNGSFNIPVSFTVTNLGVSASQPNWFDYGYLSSNGVLDSSSVVLGQNFQGSVLAAGASYTVTQTYVTSGINPGTYTVFLKADGASSPTSAGRVAESNKTNNVAAGIGVVLPTYPDLSISNTSVGTISENQNGSFNIPVSFTVTNLGVSPARPNWFDYGYLSSNGVLDSSSVVLGQNFQGSVLASGASYTVTQTYVTSGVNPGTYTVFLKTDGTSSPTSAGWVVETSKTNNVAAGLSAVVPPYPDLVISSPSVGTITKNTNGTYNIPVTFTVTNAGGSPAQPTWNDFGYLSSNGVLDANSTSIGSSFRGTALAPSASYTVTQTYLTAAVSPGAYTVFIKADGMSNATSAGFVAESNESNNVTAGISVMLNP